MEITTRESRSDDIPAILGTLDGSVAWLVGEDGGVGRELYIHWLASDRRFKAEGTRRAAVSLLRVDCYAGADGKLVRSDEGNGFTRTDTYTVKNDWPGRVLARRL